MYQKEAHEVIKELSSDETKGLSLNQIEQSREKYGKNELESKKKQSLFIRFLLEFKDILIIILLIAAVISLIIDPKEWIESVIIFVVVIINAILGIIQESKAEKSLEALKKMSSPLSKVIRDGKTIQIDSKDIVVGDIILVEAGDFIPADARLIECSNLQVDESALTGESVAVNKSSDVLEDKELPLGDQKNMLFSSTYVTNGRGKAIVCQVGMQTQIGNIANMLLDDKQELTPLQNKLNQVGSVIGLMAIAICVVVFVLEMISRVKVLDAFKTAVALAVAAIPEGLATVVTIVLAIGVDKMAKRKAIVKKLPAVETLGSTSIVCSDKTGTLTQNKMSVVRIYNKKSKELDELGKEDIDLIKYFALCCDAKITIDENGNEKRIGDPTETALIDLNNKYGEDISNIQRVKDFPFDSERKMMSVICKINGKLISITKGAPDIVINRCLDNNKKDLLKENDLMAQDALRVLALGIKELDKIPEDLNEIEQNLHFIGMVGMIDPARQEVKEAIRVAAQAGVRTIMITGDHIVTAKAIAKQLNILDESKGQIAITSEELNKLSDEQLDEIVEKISVYARVAPKDKVRIVTAWQKKDMVVAMTGDGVNDSPALKKADIGCAMGITGTDVSKEAADMTLMDDNFATIISAVKQGRGIYSNVKKCVKYLLSSNIGEVITIFLAALISAFGKDLGVPLAAIHLLWINLITDSLPAFGLGMEEPEDSVMFEKPRPKKEGFFANKLGLAIVLEGIMIGLLTLTAYLIGESQSHEIGQTMAFITLSSCQLFHSFNVKSDSSIFSKKTFNNKFLSFAFVVGMILTIGVVYIPGVNGVFALKALPIIDFLICVGLSLTTVLVMEIVKLIKNINNKKTKN